MSENEMSETEELEKMLAIIHDIQREMARFAILHPDFVDQLIMRQRQSAAMLITNIPGLKEEHQESVDEMNQFMERMQRGEIDPRSLFSEEELAELDQEKAEFEAQRDEARRTESEQAE